MIVKRCLFGEIYCIGLSFRKVCDFKSWNDNLQGTFLFWILMLGSSLYCIMAWIYICLYWKSSPQSLHTHIHVLYYFVPCHKLRWKVKLENSVVDKCLAKRDERIEIELGQYFLKLACWTVDRFITVLKYWKKYAAAEKLYYCIM